MSSFKRKAKPSTIDSPTSPIEIITEPVEPGKVANESTSEVLVSHPVINSVTGWKPWVHTSFGIISSGHRQLDELVGGGIPLGTSTLYLTENYSAFGQTLFAYNLAEGLSHGHENLVVVNNGHEAEKLLRILPLNLNLDKITSNNAVTVVQNFECEEPKTEKLSSSENLHSATKGQSDFNLKIAWQYEKYLKKQDQLQTKSLTSEKVPFCCSFDLSKRIQESLLLENMALVVIDSEENECLGIILDKILNTIMKFLERKCVTNPLSICRLYFPSFHDVIVSLNGSRRHSDYNEIVTVLGRFFVRLKRIIRDSRVAIFFSVNDAILNSHVMLLLHQVIDSVLSVNSFAGKEHVVPYEFKEYLGFFTVKKVQQYGVLAPYQPPKGSRFGIKRDRRKVHIEPLHLPPEESRSFGNNCSSDSKAVNDSSAVRVFGNVGPVEKSHQSAHNLPISITSVPSHDHIHGANLKMEDRKEETFLGHDKGGPVPAIIAAPKSSLAASLAAARSNRMAAKQVSLGDSKPVSISKSFPTSNQGNSLDF